MNNVKYGLHPEISKRYSESVRLIDDEFSSKEDEIRIKIVYTLLLNCEKARCYDFEENENRARDKDAISRASKAARDARVLAEFLKNYSMQSVPAVGSAILQTGVHVRKEADTVPISTGVAFSPTISIRLSELLDALSSALDNGALAAKNGPFEHRFRVGPILFSEPIDGRAKLPEPETCLGLFLSFLFRKMDVNGLDQRYPFRFQTGEPMPESGSPRWKIVSQLVRDSLATNIDDQNLSAKADKFVRNNKNIGFVGYIGNQAP